jgi:adenylate cyclase
MVAARIDRLPEHEKELLQILAVIGKEFRLALARRIIDKPDDELERMLTQLQLAEFIYEQPGAGDIEYTFKHVHTRDVAYNQVLVERRKVLHERIGSALESLYANSLDDHLVELAYHYSLSSNAEKAVEYCRRACEQSSDRASYAEAVGHFETGLARLQELPDDDGRAELELDLRNAVGTALFTLKGYSSPEGERSAARALELSRRPGVFWEKSWIALNGLYANALTRPSHSKARELARHLLALAQQYGSVDLTAESLFLLAFPEMCSGDFELAAESFERSISMFETTTSRISSLAWRRSIAHVTVYAVCAWNSWFLGFPDRAVRLTDKAFALARASKAAEEGILPYAVWVFFLRRQPERARETAEALATLATELGNPFRRALGEFHLGWFDTTRQGRPEGIARMRQGLADFRAIGSTTTSSYLLALIAQAQCLFARYDEALVAIDEAFAVESDERAFDAEVHRMKGELLLAKDAPNATEAEKSFRSAMDIARRQKAKSWELRAKTSLARLLRDGGRRDEARKLLSEIYNWFTEGFDTADLKDAKALLDELKS